MVDLIQAGTLVVPPTVEQPKAARQVADTPVREKASTVEHVQELQDREGNAASVASTDQSVAERPQVTPHARNAAVATYHDSDSGRLIVRIFDKDSGDILVEFPPEDPPSDPSISAGSGPARGNTSINV